MKSAIAAVLCAALCSGCANLSTLSRAKELPDDGKALYLDAKERLVYTDKDGKVCAEPSPDALATIAASLGVSALLPNGTNASVAQAFTENGAAIGLRTQSITLMRDTLYRICEQQHNGALSNQEVSILLARSQDLTVAVLAIEQLTGAVAAQQVALTGETNATATGNLAGTQANLEMAKNFEEQSKRHRDEAVQADKVQEGKVAAAEKVLKDYPPAGTTADPAEKERLTKARDEELNKRKETQLAVTDAEADYTSAKDTTKLIADNLNTAKTTANATANGKATFGANLSAGKMSEAATKDVAAAVQAIATTAITKQYLGEACIAVMLNQNEMVARQQKLSDILKDATKSLLTQKQAADDKAAVDKQIVQNDPLWLQCSAILAKAFAQQIATK